MTVHTEPDWMRFVASLCNQEGYPTIDPRRYHGSADLRQRVQNLLDQPDGWMLVLKPRGNR